MVRKTCRSPVMQDPADALRHMSDIWNDHSGAGCILITSRSTSGVVYQFLLTNFKGYLLTDMLLFSILVRDKCADLAQVRRVLVTVTLCAKGWWESKSKYLSLCVFFLKTVVDIVPLSCRTTLLSRNGRLPSTSVSVVNWMVGSIELK